MSDNNCSVDKNVLNVLLSMSGLQDIKEANIH